MRRSHPNAVARCLQVIKRTGKLFVLGLLTQGSGFPGLGNDGYDLKAIRIPGILQRIAWAYLCVALIALYVPQVSLSPLYHVSWNLFRFSS